ncbi:MAG: hypothetical protein IK123_04695, partial [Lachnospiraceae bacterium]|nr:hypothetical protein [Lachnospiraceae bacterium]
LEIYLFSGTLDIIIFDRAKRRYFEMNDFAWLFFILVPLNFILSVILSLIYKSLYNRIAEIISRLVNKRTHKEQAGNS